MSLDPATKCILYVLALMRHSMAPCTMQPATVGMLTDMLLSLSPTVAVTAGDAVDGTIGVSARVGDGGS